MYLGVRGSSRFVAESDLAFFGLAGPVTTAVRRNSVVRDEGTSSRHRGDPADPADTAAAIPRAHHGVN